MHLGRTPRLWAIDGLPEPIAPPSDDFGEALARHVRRAGEPLHTTLVQVGTTQRAYVQLLGCGGCLTGTCALGCRLRLFERVLRCGWGTARLRHVPSGPDRGLAPRPYTRVYVGLPAHDARPLDATLLHAWHDARLTLTWDYGRLRVPHPPSPPELANSSPVRLALPEAIRVGAVLLLGAGGPADPQTIFGARNWTFRRVAAVEPALRSWFATPALRGAPLRRGAPRSLAPHLLVPAPRDTERDARPDLHHVRSLADDAAVAAHGHATAIAHALEALDVRVEFLDLHPDTWTATLAAMHQHGMARLLRDLAADHAALSVTDAATATVALRTTAALAPSMLPPVLTLGTLEGDRTRYRPISPTHHLIVSGPELPGVLAGLVAPLVDGRSDVRIGILDAADGTAARQLSGLPRRLPTAQADDAQELLGVLGQISGAGVPVLVLVIARDAERCRSVLTPLMRAASYWNVSLVIAVPTEEILPPLIRERVPILRIQHREAHIASPLGLYYEWGRKTPLRLPYRDPLQRWAVPDTAVLPTPISPDAFWDIPAHLRALLVPAWRGVAPETELEADLHAAGRMQDLASADDAAAGEIAADIAAPAEWAAAPFLRFDAERQLVVDDQLLGQVLQRINGRPGETTVSVRQLRELFALPDKQLAGKLLDALRARHLVTGEPRQGHFTYLTVAQAVAQGVLADGPWTAADTMPPLSPTGSTAAADAALPADRRTPDRSAGPFDAEQPNNAAGGDTAADEAPSAPDRHLPTVSAWFANGMEPDPSGTPEPRTTRYTGRAYAIREEDIR